MLTRLSPSPPQTLDDATRAIEAAQSRLAAMGLSFRQPPPIPTTCCGRGCAGCVWESYFDAVAWWLEDAARRP